MFQTSRKKGATDVELTFRIIDNSSGEPISAAAAIAGRLWYRRPGAAVTEASAGYIAIAGAHTDNSISHIKNGYHRIDLPDAAFASGVDYVVCGFSAVSAVAIGTEVSLTDYDPIASIDELSSNAASISANLVTYEANRATMSANFSLKHTGHSANLNLILADTNELQSDDIPGTLATMSAALATNVSTNTTTIDTRIATQSANQTTQFNNITPSSPTATWQLGITSDQFSANSFAARLATLSSNASDILADTNELQTDDIPGRLDTVDTGIATLSANAASISANVVTLQTTQNTMSANLTDDIAAITPSSPTATWQLGITSDQFSANSFAARFATLSSNTSDILADTNELQSDDYPARFTTVDTALATLSANAASISANLVTVDANVDTIVTNTTDISSIAANAVWDQALTAANHNIANSAGRRLRQLQDSGAVYGGFIWIDTVNGTAGTTNYENGTSDNPVDTIADANTLATALGISRFHVAPGSSITLAATQSNQVFDGYEWTLALGGQNIAGSAFIGATVSGTGTGADPVFIGCQVASVTLATCRMNNCRFTGTITMSATGDYYFDSCYSGVAGAGTPVIDFGAAVAGSNLSIRHYSGGIQINNKDQSGTDQMSLEGDGHLIVAASSGGAIQLRGNFKVTNTGGATITYDDDTAGIQTISAQTVTTNADLHTLSANLSLKHTGHSANLNLILADTNELQTDDYPTRFDTLDTTLAALSANTSDILADTNELQTDDYPARFDTVDAALATLSANAASISANQVTYEANRATMSANLRTDLATISANVSTLVSSQSAGYTGYYKNVSGALIPFTMLDESASALGGLTPTIRVSLDGASATVGVGSVAEVAGFQGAYQYSSGQADMNADDVLFQMSNAGAVTVFVNVRTTN